MTAARFLTDEDIYAAVAPALRRTGVDAVSTPEVGRFGQADESQLDRATTQGRALVTFNVAHFANLHSTWIRQGRHHAGIIVSSQRPIGDMIRRLLHLASAQDAESLGDCLEFLGNW